MFNSLLEATQGGGMSMIGTIGYFAILIGVVYFLMIRPQQKERKAADRMRAALEVGDEIITYGGIIGTIVSIKDDTLVIETGSDRSKIRLVRTAIQYNTTAQEAEEKAKAAKKSSK